MGRGMRCVYCRDRHGSRFLCDPVKKFLDAMRARGESLTMPTIELSQPVPPLGFGEDPGDRLVRQLVVQGALVTAADVAHPALVLTGQDLAGKLPQWTYIGTDEELRAAARLVHDMAELAIRRADDVNKPASVVVDDG